MKIDFIGLVNKMDAVLDKKKERLKMLFFLSMQQRELFAVECIDRLIENLQQKQICIDEIDCLDTEFARYTSELENCMEYYSDSSHFESVINAKLQHLRDEDLEIKRLIHQIQEVDSENHKMAAELKTHLLQSMKSSAREKKAYTSYGSSQILSIAEDKG